MRVLPDANLSYRLVKKLAETFPDCLHVTRTGLPIPTEDIDIWQWARLNKRMGNQSSSGVVETLQKHYTDIQALHDSDEYGMLELF